MGRTFEPAVHSHLRRVRGILDPGEVLTHLQVAQSRRLHTRVHRRTRRIGVAEEVLCGHPAAVGRSEVGQVRVVLEGREVPGQSGAIHQLQRLCRDGGCFTGYRCRRRCCWRRLTAGRSEKQCSRHKQRNPRPSRGQWSPNPSVGQSGATLESRYRPRRASGRCSRG